MYKRQVYNNAKPIKKLYRKFNIKTVEGADDYESTKEVIARRINRAYKESEEIKNGTLAEEDAKFLPLPDLILLDGGKGHVSAVRLLCDCLLYTSLSSATDLKNLVLLAVP